ncbi:MAG: hypothetical protein GEV12_08800 [Micromonosporaceae bacterium]|nr:hypothetical protein [Micromonosporaceae bacterium]
MATPGCQPVTELHYGGCPLDRAATLRRDPRQVAALLADPGSRVIPLWRGRCLTRSREALQPVTLAGDQAAGVVAAAEQTVFLGLDGHTGWDGRTRSTVSCSSPGWTRTR